MKEELERRLLDVVGSTIAKLMLEAKWNKETTAELVERLIKASHEIISVMQQM